MPRTKQTSRKTLVSGLPRAKMPPKIKKQPHNTSVKDKKAKRYACAQFLDKGEFMIDVVPMCWLSEEEKQIFLYWPKVSKSILKQMIDQCTPVVEANSHCYLVDKLFVQNTSFEDANKMAKEKVKHDVSCASTTEAGDETVPKRRKLAETAAEILASSNYNDAM